MPLIAKVAERTQGLLESSQLLSGPNVVELAEAARRSFRGGLIAGMARWRYAA